MSETTKHLWVRHMILAEDGFLRFAPPAGCAFSEDQLAKIVHYMASINAELMLKRLTENHPNQPTK